MMRGHSNPAIYAGLAGLAGWAAPTTASALAVFGSDTQLSDVVAPFAAGCAVGALVATTASIVVVRMSGAHQSSDALEEDAQPTATHQVTTTSQERGASPAVRHAARFAQRASEGQMDDIRVQSVAESQHREPSGTRAASGRRSASTAYTPNDYVDVAEAYVRGRTLAERMAARARGVAEVLSERLSSSPMEGMPVITRADGTVGDVGESWWDAALSENQVSTAGPVLSDIDGVNESLAGNSAVLFTAQTPEEAQVDLGALRREQQAASVRPNEAAAAPATVVAQDAPAQQPPVKGRETIGERVAHTEEVFPNHEERWSSKQQDLWSVALAALDERYDEQVALGPDVGPAFGDSQASPLDDDTAAALDEPEGLEASTQFMPFRPQAGHPEVVDTEGYVDLLVNQELSRAKSPSVRRSFRDYLRLIDGGSTADMAVARHLATQA